jgi:hypothetical protein
VDGGSPCLSDPLRPAMRPVAGECRGPVPAVRPPPGRPRHRALRRGPARVPAVRSAPGAARTGGPFPTGSDGAAAGGTPFGHGGPATATGSWPVGHQAGRRPGATPATRRPTRTATHRSPGHRPVPGSAPQPGPPPGPLPGPRRGGRPGRCVRRGLPVLGRGRPGPPGQGPGRLPAGHRYRSGRLGWSGRGRQRAEFVLTGRVRPDGEGRVLVDVRVPRDAVPRGARERVPPRPPNPSPGSAHRPPHPRPPGAGGAASPPAGSG